MNDPRQQSTCSPVCEKHKHRVSVSLLLCLYKRRGVRADLVLESQLAKCGDVVDDPIRKVGRRPNDEDSVRVAVRPSVRQSTFFDRIPEEKKKGNAHGPLDEVDPDLARLFVDGDGVQLDAKVVARLPKRSVCRGGDDH